MTTTLYTLKTIVTTTRIILMTMTVMMIKRMMTMAMMKRLMSMTTMKRQRMMTKTMATMRKRKTMAAPIITTPILTGVKKTTWTKMKHQSLDKTQMMKTLLTMMTAVTMKNLTKKHYHF